jgi:hypothetical protein
MKMRVASIRIALAGFLIGTPLPLVVGWPRDHPGSGSWSRGYFYGQNRNFVIDGVPTAYGWLAYAQSVVIEGLDGAAGALAFHFTWKWLRRGESDLTSPSTAS